MGDPIPKRFWEELLRRRVVRVALIYGAGAFAIAQAADLVLGAFDASHYTRFVIGGLIGGVAAAAPPPPPPPVKQEVKATPKRITVGGNVQQAMLVNQPRPTYPPLAKQARISGTVRFTAIIGRDGAIQNLTLVSGHPLLVQAATDAVKQWRYKPTLLNGEPVEVVTQIDVNFTLNQ